MAHLTPLLLATACGLAWSTPSSGHGASYPPPALPPSAGAVPVLPAGTNAPGAGGAPAPTPASSPGPSTPAPAPSAPASAGAGNDPTTPSGTDAGDWTAWQVWWRFNRHPYLDLRRHIHTGGVLTGSDDFFLGHGRTLSRDTLRPSDETLRTRIAPLLAELLKSESSNDILSSALVALAKVGDRTGDGRDAVQLIKPFLTHANQELAETAAAALGILGREASIELLVDLLEDDVDTLRERHWLRFGRSVPLRTRAFAAYGLGLVGRDANGYHRMVVVHALVAALRGGALEEARPDVGVAAVLALGMTPLPYDARESSLEAHTPTAITSRQRQMRVLVDLFGRRTVHERVQAHIPRALADLLSDAPPDLGLRSLTVRKLVRALASKRTDREVRQGCAIALGRVADADEDELDVDVRATLRAAAESDPDQMTRRYALIAVAHCGARAGSGEGEPLAGTARARTFLLRHLASGSTPLRPWAGLAVGVLERRLLDAGQAASNDALRALRSAFDGARTLDELGAYAVASGIARDHLAAPHLRERLEQVHEPTTRGFLCIGLGLLADDAAIEPVQSLVLDSRYRPALLERAAVALGLLGDKSAAPTLTSMLKQSTSLSAQASLASALGTIGDARAIEPLVALARDESCTALARAFAVVALGRIADGDALPWNAALSVDSCYLANPPTLTDPASGSGILDIL